MEQNNEIVKFVFVKAPDYRIIAANGAFGGLTPQGLLKVDLYIDYTATPEFITHSVRSDGLIGQEVERKPSDKIISRELQVGMLLPIHIAEVIANWMLTKVREAKKETGTSK